MNGPRTQKLHALGWSRAQRRALLLLLCVLIACLGARWALHRAYVSDPQPMVGARANELASRIDPNQADWRTLAAIPQLGEKRAQAIVAYRDRRRQADPGVTVFRSADDLRGVRGIGPAMARNLDPYLTFTEAAK